MLQVPRKGHGQQSSAKAKETETPVEQFSFTEGDKNYDSASKLHKGSKDTLDVQMSNE